MIDEANEQLFVNPSAISSFDQTLDPRYQARKTNGPAMKRAVIYNIKRNQKGALNPTLISLVLIVNIVYSQLLMTILSEGMNLASSELSSEKFNRLALPFVSLVAADPLPEPVPTSARSATSGAYRAPPINGSMFGKRSVDQQATTRTYHGRRSRSEIEFEKQQQKATATTNKSSQVGLVNGRKEAVSERDTITDIIEDFLFHNNESEYHNTSTHI